MVPMPENRSVVEYVNALKGAPQFNGQVVYHTVLAACNPVCGTLQRPWPGAMETMLAETGIHDVYRHQAEAMDRIRRGGHVVLATPTASGKSLVYQLPVLEQQCIDAAARALYISPLKALAQDQKKAFDRLARRISGAGIKAAIYDGDTTAWHRGKIRRQPPALLMTNPEMVHLSLLAHHEKWHGFFPHLKLVVVDEVHTYRGLMGSHMAQVFRRLLRVCRFYGAAPVFVFCSATVANPAQLVHQLTGLDAAAVTRSGAPRGRRHVVFVNPVTGPARCAINLLKAALHRGLRTIVYTQSRKLTELMAVWAGSRAGPFADRISAYRAGFLPEERRDIEARLASGDLLAVISTSALELGIDIGDLDLCILVGYPGSVVATWQRSGRVGRSGQDAALVLVAGEDALDQYFMRHPQVLIQKGPEAAVANPYNTEVMRRHLVCAAAEIPLDADEPFMAPPAVADAVSGLEQSGELLRSADGRALFPSRKQPHRHVDLRGAGSRFNIICRETGENRGDVDGLRAYRETHPGAVYLHRGRRFLVDDLDADNRTVRVTEADLDYYTRARSHKETEILSRDRTRTVWGARVGLGRLRVTETITGYERMRLHRREKINIIPLDLPPLIFETEGLWFTIPESVQRRIESEQMHFMGGIHAVEHGAIGVFPLLVMADRNDLGGISTPWHPQLEQAAVFIYDGIPGGGGLCREAFERFESLMRRTLSAISRCPCETGCPSCVHSPKCGSGNRPIDKGAARMLLKWMAAHENADAPADPETGPGQPAAAEKDETGDAPRVRGPLSEKKGDAPRPRNARSRATSRRARRRRRTGPGEEPLPGASPHYGVFDIETRRSAQEVGGWHRADRMGVSCVVLYDSDRDGYLEFLEEDVPDLIEHLKTLDRVVGFNIDRFDYRVLKGYSDFDFTTLPTMDLLAKVHERLGYRLSLDRLATATLGVKKSADGLAALRWWKAGKIRKIIDYCRKDVQITRDLYRFGLEKGYLLFDNKAGQRVRVPVDFS
jgi:DEAD/DEAH box helicase domain-containing protein